MLTSMTGFGKATCELNTKKLTIEVRSLNSKQLDINSRIPGFYKEKEIEVRNLLSKMLHRGKVEFSMYAEISSSDNGTVVNTELVKSYYEQLQSVEKELNVSTPANLLQIVMGLPDTMKTEREELDEEEWLQVVKSIEQAISDLISYRKDEGEALEQDILMRIRKIKDLLNEVEPLEGNRLLRVKERLRNNLNEILEKDSIDQNRFEQELIFYLEKYDVTEEKVRLAKHCDYFLETAALKEPVGKKLGFISQEIGREINTLGSKANDSDIQKIVVLMKDELEKIKEQLLNVL